MHKISIVTVIFNAISNNNGKEYLEQMFKSIHNQDYENIEHLIIDGKSDDGTTEYINFLKNKYATKPVKIFSEKDSGIYNAMNKGILKSEGEFIAFMNADDYYLENNAITLLYDAIIKNQNIGFSCSDTLVETDSQKKILFNANINSVMYRMPFCHQSMLCRKNLFYKYNFFDESLEIVADYNFIIRLICNNERGVEVKKPLICFRWIGLSYKKNNEAIKEFSLVSSQFCNKKYSYDECLAIFSNKINIKLFLKLFFINFIKNSEISNINFINHVIVNYLISLKYYVRFRFIFKPIEDLIKKRKITKV